MRSSETSDSVTLITVLHLYCGLSFSQLNSVPALLEGDGWKNNYVLTSLTSKRVIILPWKKGRCHASISNDGGRGWGVDQCERCISGLSGPLVVNLCHCLVVCVLVF